MQLKSIDSTGNRFLDGLPSGALDGLQPFETVSLRSGEALHEPQVIADHAYFPIRGVISLVASMNDGTAVEIGMIGREGMLGLSAILDGDTASYRAMAQVAGSALRVKSSVLRDAAHAHAALQTRLLRYVHASWSTAAQSAACNRLHLLEQRCARWLLSAHDRVQSDTFPMTHEFLAMMLGVRRAGVTIAAQALQEAGCIRYNHGDMTILDRKGLETTSCECYAFIRREFIRLLGDDIWS